jgi:hypothetical protein
MMDVMAPRVTTLICKRHYNYRKRYVDDQEAAVSLMIAKQLVGL